MNALAEMIVSEGREHEFVVPCTVGITGGGMVMEL